MRAHLSHEEMNQLSRFLRVEQALSETCRWQIHDHLSAAGRKRERVRSEAVLAGGTFGAGSAEPVAVPDDAFHSSEGPSIRSFPSPVFADATAANRLTCWGSFPLSRPFSRAFGQAPVSLKSAAGPASSPPQTLLDPSRCMTFARHFLGQRRDGIALSLGESAGGPLPLFSRFPFPRQARSGTLRVSPLDAFACPNTSH